ncbi:MAG: hypothetical protein KF871_10740 [Hydrogenophaga sp.]|uniref:hypothetical protein n=1 Tax=Hydrogenophaga sp. TaxID=1904254 RepID=UPI001D72BF9B|nr:hypothetical protein [Hydrogenophaga sp.]MBX3610359.1 hypothetical protein [Hydrogenophaga sp.]
MTPAVGTFLRPVGLAPMYAYCGEVCHVWPPSEDDIREVIRMRRHAMDRQHQPFDDGHRGEFFLSGLRSVRDGVWKDENPWWGSPRYWVQMQNEQPGQLELF